MTPSVALVTGFGPFLDVADNPSERLARALDGREHAGLRIVGRVLPVSYERAPRLLAAAIEELRPRCVVALGAGGGELRIEVAARNRVGALEPDDDGRSGVGEALDAVGPPSRRVEAGLELRLRSWVAGPAGRGPAARLSEDAGGYVCNALYYALLGHGLQRAVFVHLPRRPDATAFADVQAAILSLISHTVSS